MAQILAMYNHLPYEIVVKIFNRDFIKKLDIFRYYLSDDKPMTGIHLRLLGLNRIVCATYPEYKLPWYCEDMARQFISTYDQ